MDNIIIPHDEGCDKVFIDKRINLTGYSVDIFRHLVWLMDNERLVR